MAIIDVPLPQQISQQPGGLAGEFNTLRKQAFENKIKSIEAQYAPFTVPARALSQLAYANFVQPQYIAKLLQNKDFVANLNPQQINAFKSIAMGSGTGNTFSNLPNQPQINNNDNSVLGKLSQLIQSLLHPSQQTQNPTQNALQQPVRQNLSQPVQSNDFGYSYDQSGKNVVMPKNQVDELANQRMQESNAPQTNFTTQAANLPNREYFERAGAGESIKSQRKEEGTIRAKAEDELDQQYQSAIEADVPIHNLMDISQNPTFINMRNSIPFFQDYQLKALAKMGTPAQQKLVGNFVTTVQKLVADTVMGFRGRILQKEFDVANNMKVSPDDTWNVMIGKLESIATFNEMTKQRARIAADLIKNEHLSRGEALTRADHAIHADAIRKNIVKKLNPQPSAADVEYMAKKYKTTPEEIKKRLKKKGYQLEIQLLR